MQHLNFLCKVPTHHHVLTSAGATGLAGPSEPEREPGPREAGFLGISTKHSIVNYNLILWAASRKITWNFTHFLSKLQKPDLQNKASFSNFKTTIVSGFLPVLTNCSKENRENNNLYISGCFRHTAINSSNEKNSSLFYFKFFNLRCGVYFNARSIQILASKLNVKGLFNWV